MHQLSDELYAKWLVAPGDMAATGAHTTSSVDMETCRDGQIVIGVTTAGADTCGTMTVEDSTDDSTFAGVDAFTVSSDGVTSETSGIANIAAGETGTLLRYNVRNMRRYVRFKYTTAVAGASFLGVLLLGARAQYKPTVD